MALDEQRTSNTSDEDGRLELALKASNEGIWDWRTERKDIFFSHRILEFLGVEEGEHDNPFLPPHKSVHPEDLEKFSQRFSEAMGASGPSLLAIDCRLLRGDGSWVWLRIRGSIVRNSEGAPIRIAGSMIDISKRKQAQEQIAEDRHLLHQLIDKVPLQIYFKDEESRFVIANKQMAEWMGQKSPTDLIGRHDRDFFQSKHSKQAYEDEKTIMSSREPITAKLEKEDWNEDRVTWVLTSKFPWMDRRGAVKGTFGVSSDVTELVEAKRSSARMARQLQKKNEVLLEEVHLAKEIQQMQLQDHLPSLTYKTLRVDLTSRFVPHSALAGDLFKIIPINKYRVGILICDVMGHGVRSALVVAMIHGLVEKQHSIAHKPGAYLSSLNQALHSILQRSDTTIFSTALYAVIDLRKSSITCACAGHPPALRLHNGETSIIGADKQKRGPGLGLVDHFDYPIEKQNLKAGDRLLLFTDGLIEEEDDRGDSFGIHGLEKALQHHCAQELEAATDALVRDVRSFSPKNAFSDDVCLVGLEIKPS